MSIRSVDDCFLSAELDVPDFEIRISTVKKNTLRQIVVVFSKRTTKYRCAQIAPGFLR